MIKYLKHTHSKLFLRLICSYWAFSFILVSPIYATNIDSLKTCLQEQRCTKEVFEIYQAIGNHYHQKHIFDSAVFYFSQALHQKISEEQKMICYKKIGNVYVDSTNYSLALEYLNKALQINSKVKNVEEYPNLYNLKGMCYGLTNDLNQAIISFQDALKFNIQLYDSSGIGLSYYNIGLANHFMGHYEKAIENFIKSADIRRQIGETKSLVASLISIGEVFRLRGDYNNAQIYYDEAIKHKAKLDNKETLAYLYSELALIHKATKQYETSLAYIDTAMNYSQEINYKRGIVTLLCYKAGIYKEQGKLNQSLKIYDETIERYKEIGFETGIIQSNIAKAEILTEKKQYNQALNILLDNRPMAINNELLDEQTEISEIKYKLHKVLNQNDLALTELELFIVLSDSLFGIEKEKKIKEIEAKYETKQKKQQIELLDKENKISTQKIKARNLILTLLLVFVLLLILFFFLLQKKRKAISELEIEKNRHRLLQAQMNPHFIYNSLSAIQSFILKNNPMDSVTYISEFSSLTRLVLEGVRCDLITLDEDIKLVNAYLKLQQMRFGNKFNFKIEVNEKINTELIKLPPMLSQPFIENAVEHGMRNKKDGDGRIIVDYSVNEQNLIVTISDNGEGFQESKEVGVCKHKSLATKITNERIENIRKTLNLAIRFQLNSDDSGTKVIFTIPQKK